MPRVKRGVTAHAQNEDQKERVKASQSPREWQHQARSRYEATYLDQAHDEE